MRITMMMTILAAAAGMAANADAPAETITVYVHDRVGVPPQITYLAEAFASRMFAGIGVRIQWRSGKPPADAAARPIEIIFDTQTPEDFNRGALAYALPFEAVHIHVFYDRVQRAGESNPTWLLAHVLVHEITHMLQGVARHSPDGIMKAQWSAMDIAGMRGKPLPFTADDVRLIREGMNHRQTTPAVMARADSAAVVTR